MCLISKSFIDKNLNTRKATKNSHSNILATNQMQLINVVYYWSSPGMSAKIREVTKLGPSAIWGTQTFFWQFIIYQKMIGCVSG